MNAIPMQTLVGTLFFPFVHTLCSTNNPENKFFQQRHQYVLFEKYSNPITYLDIHLHVRIIDLYIHIAFQCIKNYFILTYFIVILPPSLTWMFKISALCLQAYLHSKNFDKIYIAIYKITSKINWNLMKFILSVAL